MSELGDAEVTEQQVMALSDCTTPEVAGSTSSELKPSASSPLAGGEPWSKRNATATRLRTHSPTQIQVERR
jgi:hypothetical protein